jgi:predicted nucleotidyltransferase
VKTIDQELLEETVRRIVTALQPKAIYLYGSHAYGQPHKDSDVDIFVVVDDSELPPHRRAVAAYRALRGLYLPAEIKVATTAEFERRARWSSSVERAVLDRAKVLYESAS